jgi:hypothetical protein
LIQVNQNLISRIGFYVAPSPEIDNLLLLISMLLMLPFQPPEKSACRIRHPEPASTMNGRSLAMVAYPKTCRRADVNEPRCSWYCASLWDLDFAGIETHKQNKVFMPPLDADQIGWAPG